MTINDTRKTLGLHEAENALSYIMLLNRLQTTQIRYALAFNTQAIMYRVRVGDNYTPCK